VRSLSTTVFRAGERQLRVYGTRDGANGSTSPQRQRQRQPAAAATAESAASGGEASSASRRSSDASAGNYGGAGTPRNTPAGRGRGETNGDDGDDGNGNGVLLCPRGLAAIPLLCAAASESRSAYLARLQVTHPSNGVRQRSQRLRKVVNAVCSLTVFYDASTCFQSSSIPLFDLMARL